MNASSKVLIIVDVQNDFCPGGALAVPDGHEVVPVINRLIAEHEHVVLTQDWHPPDHFSFASRHQGRESFETIQADYGLQTLWPDHCVQGTPGADFHPELDRTKAELIIRKGFRAHIDSYSAFFENDHKTPTGLCGYLRERGFNHVALAGLATDYCVHFSAMDAHRLGYDVTVLEYATRAIDLEESLAAARKAWAEAGVKVA